MHSQSYYSWKHGVFILYEILGLTGAMCNATSPSTEGAQKHEAQILFSFYNLSLRQDKWDTEGHKTLIINCTIEKHWGRFVN